MAEAAGRRTWAVASAVMALLANCHRDPRRQRAFRPADFDPYRRAQGDGGPVETPDRIPIRADNIADLKAAMLGKD